MTYDWKLYLCDDQGRKCFGLGPMQLLRNVSELGSLKKAAEAMNLSYNKALSMIKTAEKGLGFPLLDKKIGGERGGGSALTPAAWTILQQYQDFCLRLDQSAGALFQEIFGA